MTRFVQQYGVFFSIDPSVTQMPYTRSRRVFVVPGEYLQSELGYNGNEVLTESDVGYIENELGIRGILKADEAVYKASWDAMRESLNLLVISPRYQPVPVGAEPPETIVS